MPIISMFYGIIVRMYYADNQQHHVPHIHAEFGDDKAVFSIQDGKYLQASFQRIRPVSCSRGLKFIARSLMLIGNWQ
jgi:hypothetical protein